MAAGVFLRFVNKYSQKTNLEECNKVLLNCTNIIHNVNTLLKPYLPFSCETVDKYLNKSTNKWEHEKASDIKIESNIKPLYVRYDKSIVEEEQILVYADCLTHFDSIKSIYFLAHNVMNLDGRKALSLLKIKCLKIITK